MTLSPSRGQGQALALLTRHLGALEAYVKQDEACNELSVAEMGPLREAFQALDASLARMADIAATPPPVPRFRERWLDWLLTTEPRHG
jgi:hypothetical protein